jgi:hypothetical protein
MSSTRRYTRAEIEALPPAISLAELGRCLDRSEPVIRAAVRSGELAELGITVNKLGAKYIVITSTVWAYLGLSPDSSGAIPEATVPGGQGKGRPTASGLRSVRGGGAA